MSHDRDCHHTYRQPAQLSSEASPIVVPASQLPSSTTSSASSSNATTATNASKVPLAARVSKPDVIAVFCDHSRASLTSPPPPPPFSSSNGSSRDSSAVADSSAATRSLVRPLPEDCIHTTGQSSYDVFVNAGSSLRQGSLSDLEKQIFEPAHSAIDHIASEGYEHESIATARELMDAIPSMPKVLCELISSYRTSTHGPFFWSKRYGASHNDSKPFTTLDATSATLLVAGYHVTKIIGFSNKYANGVQLEYGPYASRVSTSDSSTPASGSNVAVEEEEKPHVLGSNMFSRKIGVKRRSKRPSGGASSSSSSSSSSSADPSSSDVYTAFALVGSHDDPITREFVLGSDEIITGVDFHVGQYGDSLRFHTSLGRTFRLGSSNGGSPVAFRAPPDMALVALQGAVGGHLHNIGVCFAPVATWKEIPSESP